MNDLPEFTPPHPNLIVSLLHPDRDAVQSGAGLGFYVVVDNVGFRWWNDTQVELVDETLGVSIGTANVTLSDFRGTAAFGWTASGLGNHTFRATVDPLGGVVETNETDNDATVVVSVTSLSPIGKPDLSIRPIQIANLTDVEENVTASVSITVRNLGDATASNVTVEVWEDERSLLVDNYTIVSAAPSGQDVHVSSWTPNATGARHLTILVDPYQGRAEHNETNNEATAGFHVRPAGSLSVADPPHILPWCPRALIWGDWHIRSGEAVYIDDCYVRVYGDVLVDGTLVLNRSTIALGAIVPNQYKVEARASGLLVFNESMVVAVRSVNPITVVAQAGSTFHFLDSEAVWTYGEAGLPYWTAPPGGVQLYTPNVRVENSTFREGATHGLYVGSSVDAGVLYGNTVMDNAAGAGVAFAAGSQGVFAAGVALRNHVGILARFSSPVLDDNVVQANGYGLFVSGPSSAEVHPSNVFLDNHFGILFAFGFEGPVPLLDGVDVLLQDASLPPMLPGSRFGVYSLWSNLTLLNAELLKAIAIKGAVGVVVDMWRDLADVRPVVSFVNVYSHYDYPFWVRNATVVSLSDSDFSAPSNPGWFIDTIADVWQNNWTEGVGHLASLDSVLNASSNGFDGGGACNGVSVWGVASVLRLSGNTFERGGCSQAYTGISTTQATQVTIENETFLGTRHPIDLRDRSWGLVMHNTMTAPPTYPQGYVGTGIYLRDSSSESLLFENEIVNYARSIYLDNTTASVYRNELRAPYHEPGYPYDKDDPSKTHERGHVAVYGNTSATIRDNVLEGGVWGISLDDRLGQVPRYRNNNALIQNNTILRNGFIGIGVDTSAYADIIGNAISNSSGWAVQVESGFETNIVRDNWINETNGHTTLLGPYTWTAMWLGREGDVALGSVELRDNHVWRSNGTGIRATRAKNLTHVHNNTVDGDGRLIEAGITLHGGTGGQLRVENNSVQGYEMGLWVKGTFTTSDIRDNVFRDNDEGARVGYGDVYCPAVNVTRAFVNTTATLTESVIEGNAVGVNASAANESYTCGTGKPLWINWTVTALHTPHVRVAGGWIAGNRTGTTEGVRVRSYVTNDTLPAFEPRAEVTRAVIANATYGVYLQGVTLGGAPYRVWADLTDNNTVGASQGVPGNAYGVWIDAGTVDLAKLRLWWNDLAGNGEGVHVTGDPFGTWGDYFHAECNWWGSVDGPYDPTQPPPFGTGPPDYNPNPDPNAEPVSDWFHYRDESDNDPYWLQEPALTATSCKG